jgi:1,4-alpha-glucan branching enzyme
MADHGYLALVLHAHLPYVRHPEYDEFLEEDWLFEAIVETYLPLLEVLSGLVDDGVQFQLTMSLTPTLCHMLRDPLLQQRATRYLERGVELARREVERTAGQGQLEEIARFYHDVHAAASAGDALASRSRCVCAPWSVACSKSSPAQRPTVSCR